MPNVENILKVADAIEKHEIPGLGFNMGTVIAAVDDDKSDLTGNRCGTVACIAGWAISIAAGVSSGEAAEDVYWQTTANLDSAADFLGLQDDEANRLFFGVGSPQHLMAIGPADAIRTLRHLAAGEVDWSV